MDIKTHKVKFATKGHTDIIDITGKVDDLVADSGFKEGIANIFTVGSTAGISTVEYEPGLIQDLKVSWNKLVPENSHYAHNAHWGDGNGYAHVRSSLLKSSLNIPFIRGKLCLGTWQQIIYLDFDNRSRQREIIVQVIGK